MSGWAQRDAERAEDEADELEALRSEAPRLRETASKHLADAKDMARAVIWLRDNPDRDELPEFVQRAVATAKRLGE